MLDRGEEEGSTIPRYREKRRTRHLVIFDGRVGLLIGYLPCSSPFPNSDQIPCVDRGGWDRLEYGRLVPSVDFDFDFDTTYLLPFSASSLPNSTNIPSHLILSLPSPPSHIHHITTHQTPP